MVRGVWHRNRRRILLAEERELCLSGCLDDEIAAELELLCEVALEEDWEEADRRIEAIDELSAEPDRAGYRPGVSRDGVVGSLAGSLLGDRELVVDLYLEEAGVTAVAGRRDDVVVVTTGANDLVCERHLAVTDRTLLDKQPK